MDRASKLRAKTWARVSYGDLNSAVTGTLSNVAIAMVKQTEAAIFVDFSGHEYYETVMKTITQGDPEKAQGKFRIKVLRISEKHSVEVVERFQEVNFDLKEQFKRSPHAIRACTSIRANLKSPIDRVRLKRLHTLNLSIHRRDKRRHLRLKT